MRAGGRAAGPCGTGVRCIIVHASGFASVIVHSTGDDDAAFLAALGDREGLALAQLRATAASNERHREWAYERVAEACGGLESRRIALLGLVYKPGTDTLRASTAVALARRLREHGADVVAYDPAIPAGDDRVSAARTVASAAEALAGADCAVVATAWPEFRDIPPASFEAMRERRVVDPARFLEDRLAAVEGLRYVAFGRGRAPQGVA